MNSQKREILAFKRPINGTKILGYLLAAVLIINVLVLIINSLLYLFKFNIE